MQAKTRAACTKSASRPSSTILFPAVLRHTHGHQTQASELLGLSRVTLRHKLRKLGLGVDKISLMTRRREC